MSFVSSLAASKPAMATLAHRGRVTSSAVGRGAIFSGARRSAAVAVAKMVVSSPSAVVTSRQWSLGGVSGALRMSSSRTTRGVASSSRVAIRPEAGAVGAASSSEGEGGGKKSSKKPVMVLGLVLAIVGRVGTFFSGLALFHQLFCAVAKTVQLMTASKNHVTTNLTPGSDNQHDARD
jgi:hypothetical protein